MIQPQRDYVRFSLDGLACSSCVEVEVSVSNYRQAGTFRACLALTEDASDQPFWDLLLASAEAGTPTGQVEIDIGNGDAAAGSIDWRSVLLGRVDQISMDVQTGLVEIEGRDLLARLIECPSTQNFVNQTSSEIVSALANAVGLQVAIQSTTTIVGQFYQIEHSRGSLNTFTRFANAFDIIAYLAQAESFDVWMTGDTLNFAAAPLQAPITLTIDITELGPNTSAATTIKSLRLDRRVALDGGAQVSVRSWNSRQRMAVESSFPPASNGTSTFTFLSPNLSDRAALAKAESLHNDIVRHRLAISGEMTGDLTLMPRSLVQVVGSRGWDSVYVVDSVTRQMSAERGFSQSFLARAQ